ncbi:hypothetical protein [Paracoccus sp. KR1-242]|uniref:hypothetical protein n=1 Tax=Paracoccus sp. KR1-242 TaxID=3410028 RepID=UPI003C08E2A1
MTLRTLLRERPATLVKSLAAVIGIAALSWGQGAAAETITVTDLAGRTVEVPHGAKKVILGGGRMF